jgi:hypothetical protein
MSLTLYDMIKIAIADYAEMLISQEVAKDLNTDQPIDPDKIYKRVRRIMVRFCEEAITRRIQELEERLKDL